MDINKNYNENALITLRRMPSFFLDMILTSPPYDELRQYNGFDFPFEEIATEMWRVMKRGGVIIWVVNDETKDGSETGTSFEQALFFKELGFDINDTMIYRKKNYLPKAGLRYQQCFEFMFCFSKGRPKTFNPIMKHSKYSDYSIPQREKNGEFRTSTGKNDEYVKVENIFSYSTGGFSTKDKITFEHPAVFPEKLAYDQIITWSNENDLIYDPCMGSGTTAKVCHITKRNWIGSEISEEFCDIIKRRLQLTSNTLFDL